MSDEQEQACECPTGKALRKMMAVLPAINRDFWAIYDGEAKAALSAPCSCAELRKERDRFRAELAALNVIAGRRANEALRAELQTARDEIAQHDLWREEAYRQIAALRARVEALEAALLDIRSLPRIQEGYVLSDAQLLDQVQVRVFAALKPVQPQETGTPKTLRAADRGLHSQEKG